MAQTDYNEIEVTNVAKVSEEEETTATAQEENPVEKKRKAIVKGEVAKPNIFKRLGHSLFGPEKMKNMGRYVAHDVIGPAIKDMVVTGFHTVIDMTFNSSGGSYRGGYGSHSYRGYYGGSNTRRDYGSAYYANQTRGVGQTSLSGDTAQGDKFTDYRNINLPGHQAAVDVLNALRQDIEDYGVATIANYLDYTGWTAETSLADNMYGWRNLDNVQIHPGRGGMYRLGLPAPRLV